MLTPRARPYGLPAALRLDRRFAAPLPEQFAADDVRFPEELVEVLVDRLSAPGDVVIDPFAGFGTVPAVAERMARQGWGVEVDGARAAYIRSCVRAPERIFTADARALHTLPIPSITLAVTSPPHSAPGDPCDALAAYRGANPGYAAYLRGIQMVFGRIGALLAPEGRAVIEVSDLRRAGRVIPLAHDIARAVGEILPFAGEIPVYWQSPRTAGRDRSSCLLFSSPAGRAATPARPARAPAAGAATSTTS